MDDEDLVVSRPDPQGAMVALATAAGLLESAQSGFARRDYDSSFTDARDSIRLASSAILMRDGYVATSLDATTYYLDGRYAGMLPLDSWTEMETSFSGEAGMTSLLLRALGKNKKPDKENTEQALAVAGSFLTSVKSILGVR